MSVALLGEINSARKSRLTIDSTREHTRVFLVATSDATIDGYVVSLATGLPQRGDTHPVDPQAHVTDVQPSIASEDDYKLWQVTVTYSTDLNGYFPDPTLRPSLYTWSTEEVQVGAGSDLDGLTIENSAHDTFEEPAVQDVAIDVIKVECTRASFNKATHKDPYLRRVNSIAWTIDGQTYRPGQAILWDLDVSMIDEFGVYYRKFAYTFKARTDLFSTRVFSATTTADQLAGDPVVSSLTSTAQITYGDELIYDKGGPNEETVIVNTIGVGFITAAFTKDHLSNTSVTIRKYVPWQYNPLDRGFNSWNLFTLQPELMYTRDGQPLTHPVLLNGSGNRLATWAGAAPVYLHFRMVPSADLNEILLP